MLKRVAVQGGEKGALRTDRRGACRRVHNLAGFGHTAANLLKAGRGPLLGSGPFASLQDGKGGRGTKG